MGQTAGQLNKNGTILQQGLARLGAADHDISSRHKETVHVVGVGGTLTSAYEQLRNAAEYTEEHLLLQKAIARFYRRLFVMRDHEQIQRSGKELVTELTLAGYVANDSVSIDDVNAISQLATDYATAYAAIEKRRGTSQDQVAHWTVDVLSSRVEAMFNDHSRDMAFAEFAYRHFLETYPSDTVSHANASDKENYAVILYIAVLRTLLHVDEAMIRSALLERYSAQPGQLETYIALNKQLDEVFAADSTKKRMRVVDREGAPLRIIRQMIASDHVSPTMFDDRSSIMNVATQQIETEYSRIERRINRAIVKSVLFLFITKVLIGIALEVPYDMIMYRQVIWFPLIINLLFPPLFMLLLRYTLVLPGRSNTAAIVDKIDELLYKHEKTVMLRRQSAGEKSRSVFRVAYGICAIAIITLTIWGLVALQFSWLHIIIFFIFVSTASFLGFRLSRIVRELEVGEAEQSGVAVLRDFIYTPFVVMGQWLSNTYSQINIVSVILDMLIELPLKTILRLIRQWSRFISERQDEL